MIIKSILARKRRLIALFTEIVIVTIIGWIIIEPIAVNTAIALTPAGYDHDRLVNVMFSQLDTKSPTYDKSAEENDEVKDYENLLRMIRERQGVEKATFAFWNAFDNMSRSSMTMQADSTYKSKGIENLEFPMTCINYLPHNDFFSTYGIKDANGNDIQEPDVNDNQYIISNSVAKAMFPNASAIGKVLFSFSGKTSEPITVASVTPDLPYRKGDGRTATYYEPADTSGWNKPSSITMRLGEGVNPHTFIDKLSKELSSYRSGNRYLTHPVYMSDQRESVFAQKKRELTQKWIIAAFFLFNVLLGVAGTFYVQCKTRISDAGVMRAFGATRRDIIWNIVGEALFTVTIGWLIGSTLYLIYLKVQGFPMETDADSIIQYLRPIWYDTKLGRCSIIGGIILVLLLLTAALGAWLPARKVGRVPIVDSLRDE